MEKFAPNTCFICASDRIAVGVVRAIQKNGNIPRDFGIIGFDGVFLDQVSNPKLTTIKQNLFKLGELLAEMILQKIKQGGAQQGEVLIEPELIKSESTRIRKLMLAFFFLIPVTYKAYCKRLK